ncbi:immunoglobulin domain-containing protein, partial [Maribellus mangrovi]|uniref:immunoglobulin domain-containing protein n=1 Tax=Maribellus mangrovi TaxID=3133146 RepID=UPI0030ECCECB
MKKLYQTFSTSRAVLMVLLMGIFLLETATTINGQVDGNYSLKTDYLTDPNDEYYDSFTKYYGQASGTCDVEQVWAKLITNGSGEPTAIQLGFQNGNNGAAIFRIYLDTEPGTGLTVDTDLNPDFPVSGADYILQIGVGDNGNFKVFDEYLTEITDDTGISGVAGDFENPGDGEFFEIYIPFEDIGFDICDPSGVINIAEYVAVSGNSIGSNRCGVDTLSLQIGVGGMVTPDIEICSGEIPGKLSLNGQKGTVSKWQYSTTNDDPWNDITSGIEGTFNVDLTEFTPSEPLTGTTYFRAMVAVPGCEEEDLLPSLPATITVVPGPTITGQPQDFNLTYNTDGTYATANATFNVSATGDGILSYQWQVQEPVGAGETPTWVDLDGETSSSLTIENAQNYETYAYRCIVSIVDGCETPSETATILPPASCPQPVITSGPLSLSNVCINSTASFSVTVQGSAASHDFQWYKGTPPTGTLIVGATSATYTISSVSIDDAGSYYVIATNACGQSVTSSAATLSLDDTPPVVDIANGSETVECLSAASPPDPIPTATDVCDGTIQGVLVSTVDYVDGVEGTITCEGTRVYTYSYTDLANNVSYWTYTYTVDRTIDPAEVIAEGQQAVSTSSTVECEAGAVAPTLPTVEDVCGTT